MPFLCHPNLCYDPLMPSGRQVAHEKNDTVIQFRSPPVNDSLSRVARTYIKLDNWEKDLRNFDYHPDPVFYELPKKVFTEASIIIVTVSECRREAVARCLLLTLRFPCVELCYC